MGLEVIGAGFGRTGTLSLKTALEQLGLGPCHHMFEVIKNPEEQVPFFLDAARILDASTEADTDADIDIDWDVAYGKYKSAVDFPTCRFYKQLMEKYPGTKVILTVRDPEKWYESYMSTIYPMRVPDSQIPIAKMMEDLGWKGMFHDNFEDKDATIKVFKDNIEQVKKHVPKEKLLVFSVKEGWEPLCKFLDVSVPSTPFPHVNNRESMEAIAQKVRAEIEQGTRG